MQTMTGGEATEPTKTVRISTTLHEDFLGAHCAETWLREGEWCEEYDNASVTEDGTIGNRCSGDE